MGLYKKWCDATKEKDKRKRYWTYGEKDRGRDEIATTSPRPCAPTTIGSSVSPRMSIGSATRSPRNFCEAIPQTDKGRSGDLGEILATELVEEEIGLRVPVRRLATRTAATWRCEATTLSGMAWRRRSKLWLLKGEAKSNKVLGKATVTSARKVLNRDNGRCTPQLLAFVANRLLEATTRTMSNWAETFVTKSA